MPRALLANLLKLATMVFFAASVSQAADAPDPIAVYKSGDYTKAIPLLQAAASKTPPDPTICAALLSSLVYEGRVDEATDLSNAYETQFSNSPEVIAARGEYAFYMGDMPQAEKLFRVSAGKGSEKDEPARAAYGLYRVYYAGCQYRTARLLCLRAHQLDPDDALITLAFMRYLMPEKRREVFGPFMSAHPWFFGDRYEAAMDSAAEVRAEMAERKAFEIEGGEPKEVTVPLLYLRKGPTHVVGIGLELSIQGGHRLRMLFDTGASGILISQSAVDKAGLNHLGSVQSRGIGDAGPRSGFAAVAESCGVGNLQFKTCIFRALEGKGRVVSSEEDGLIGSDFFSNYIVQIDFQRRTLHLTPHAPRPPNPQGYDREAPGDEATWSPVWRFGPHLYISTRVNGKSSGLFLLDTGSELSMMDSTFARLSTKIHGDQYMRVHGISGQVKDVFEADKAELEFAHFRQHNLGLTSLNLNNGPGHQEVRMSGIMGIPLLSMFRLSLDYRNGLVNFDYTLK